MPNAPRAREMELVALALLDAQTEPVGSPRLVTAFQAKGIEVAEATAGRFLRSLDERGLTHRVGRRGRLITEQGRRQLQLLRQAERLDEQSSALVRRLTASDAEELADILYLRRAVEGEAARLAAIRASDEERALLCALACHHERHVAVGEDGKPDALHFHLAVAQAAHSPIVQTTVELLIQSADDPFMTLLDVITVEAGAQFGFAEEHCQVADAILVADDSGAERAMRHHIDELIVLVERVVAQKTTVGAHSPS
ncbi:MAG: FCD domain-containing protein [Thermomicrobiales bacterium]|nr:FCD domain-containing protein [Thermomicrobiales bacterium]MCO5220677.1 FCD domain-containing protein [Thermomicrobiales bacterium]